MTNPVQDTKPAEKALINEEEDLFNFDELIETSSPAPAAPIPAAAVDTHNDAAMTAVLGPAPGAAATPSASAPAANSAAPAPAAAAAATPTANFVLQPAPRSSERLSKLTLGLIVGGVTLNLLVIAMVWSSMRTLAESLASNSRPQVEPSPSLLAPNTPHSAPHEPTVSTKPLVPAALEREPEGDLELARANEAMQRGDFEGARRTLYELMCLVDRWPAKVRDDVEARASFMLGDSFRMQADALAAAQAKTDAQTGDADHSVHAAETRRSSR